MVNIPCKSFVAYVTWDNFEVMARALPIALLCIVASFLSAEAKS